MVYVQVLRTGASRGLDDYFVHGIRTFLFTEIFQRISTHG